MNPFWLSSPWRPKLRQVQRPGAHVKWARANPDEHEAVRARFERESGEPSDCRKGRTNKPKTETGD